jgi:hypothetical protein
MSSCGECFEGRCESPLSSLKRIPRCGVQYGHVGYLEGPGTGGAGVDERLNRLFYRETVRGSGVAEGKVARHHGDFDYIHVRVAVCSLNRAQGPVLLGARSPAFQPNSFRQWRRVPRTR